jgi:hypothetical protein
MLRTNEIMNNQASIHTQFCAIGKNMNINNTEMYTGMSAIAQMGRGLSYLSLVSCGVSFDMVLMNDYQNLKLRLINSRK